MRRSLILDTIVRVEFHGLLVVSAFLLFAGHNQPGGGFAGGLVAGAALCLRYVAGGSDELRTSTPIAPTTLMGVGLVIASLTALGPLLWGQPLLDQAVFGATLPGLGKVKSSTAQFFDLGVYLVVVGMVIELLDVLGRDRDTDQELLEDDAP
jgi:multicomponent Na+:H+ antiporter subunit A